MSMLDTFHPFNADALDQQNRQAEANLAHTQAQIPLIQAQTADAQAQAQEREAQARAVARQEKDAAIIQGAIARAHGAPNPQKAVDEAIIRGGISGQGYQAWTQSQADIGAHIAQQEREKNQLSQALHKEAAQAIGGVLEEPDPASQAAAYAVVYPNLLKTLDPEEAQQLPAPDKFDPAQHAGLLRTVGGALDIAAAHTEAVLKKQNAKKAELDAIEAQRVADFVKKDPGGLKPSERVTADDKKTDNEQARANAERQALRDAETQRHNLASEERLARVAALAVSKDAKEKPLPTQAIKGLDERVALADQMTDLNDNFKPEYAGHYVTGGAGNTVGELSGGLIGANPDQVEWWKSYQNWVNDVRKKLFGSALTATEKGEFNKAIITPRTDPKIAADFLAKQQKLAHDALARETNIWEKGGYNKDQIGEFRREGSSAATAAPAAQANPNPTGYVKGHRYGGLVYNGGDPNKEASWSK